MSGIAAVKWGALPPEGSGSARGGSVASDTLIIHGGTTVDERSGSESDPMLIRPPAPPLSAQASGPTMRAPADGAAEAAEAEAAAKSPKPIRKVSARSSAGTAVTAQVQPAGGAPAAQSPARQMRVPPSPRPASPSSAAARGGSSGLSYQSPYAQQRPAPRPMSPSPRQASAAASAPRRAVSPAVSSVEDARAAAAAAVELEAEQQGNCGFVAAAVAVWRRRSPSPAARGGDGARAASPSPLPSAAQRGRLSPFVGGSANKPGAVETVCAPTTGSSPASRRPAASDVLSPRPGSAAASRPQSPSQMAPPASSNPALLPGAARPSWNAYYSGAHAVVAAAAGRSQSPSAMAGQGRRTSATSAGAGSSVLPGSRPASPAQLPQLPAASGRACSPRAGGTPPQKGGIWLPAVAGADARGRAIPAPATPPPGMLPAYRVDLQKVCQIRRVVQEHRAFRCHWSAAFRV